MYDKKDNFCEDQLSVYSFRDRMSISEMQFGYILVSWGKTVAIFIVLFLRK